MRDLEEIDLDTTLVRHGHSATTFTDMTEFVAEIEERPLDKLLCDLPGLVKLSEMKFVLARRTLQRRFAALPAVEREQLAIMAREVSLTAEGDDVERIRSVFVTEAAE